MIKSRPRVYLLSLIVALLWSCSLWGQVRDTTKAVLSQQELIDSEMIQTFEDPIDERAPAKASIYSAVLPGLGQAYNKQYWKIPILYGGIIIIGYYINFNHQQYVNFRRELFAEIDLDPNTNPSTDLSEEVLRRGTDEWRRNRDLLYFTAGLVYMLNIVDAHVSSHLKSFDIDENISMKIEPTVDHVDFVGAPVAYYPGMSIKFRFK
jgi:hypothetical protein